MFRDAPKSVSLAQLRFLRWLAEQGRLEHPVAGPPSGEFADGPEDMDLADPLVETV
jgi:hypothetical protein